jgi:hypothetical protein
MKVAEGENDSIPGISAQAAAKGAKRSNKFSLKSWVDSKERIQDDYQRIHTS